MFGWAYSYFTYRRGARLITDHWEPPEARARPSVRTVERLSA
jgi:hypothetical protein